MRLSGSRARSVRRFADIDGKGRLQVTLPEEIPDILKQHPAVSSVRLTGSRERGDALPLSDWDYILEVTDPSRVVADIPGLMDRVGALAHQWDPLSDRWNYMVMLPGPAKVDLIIEQPHEPEPPWVVTAGTLPRIEHHFWDWTLWLAAKRARGLTDLVSTELGKMFEHLLGPLGVERSPTTIEEAIRSYVGARDAFERRSGVRLDRTMEQQVTAAIRAVA